MTKAVIANVLKELGTVL